MAVDPRKMFDTGYFKSDRIMPAHKCRMCVTTMREVPDGTGDNHFETVSCEWHDINGHQFRLDLTEDYKKGIKREIEIVYEKPKTFVFNRIYLLATRDTMWVWTLLPTED